MINIVTRSDVQFLLNILLHLMNGDCLGSWENKADLRHCEETRIRIGNFEVDMAKKLRQYLTCIFYVYII